MIKLPPILLHYYITERCNCRCRFCELWRKPGAGDARPDDVRRNLAAARNLGVRFVDFTGGEPLLHGDLPAMLRYAKELGLLTSVTTNGLLYAEAARRMAGLVDFLHFSLDALDESLHNELRGRDAFAEVMQNIDLALSLGETPDLLFTLTPENRRQLRPLVRFAQTLGLMLIVNPLFSVDQPHQVQTDLLAEAEAFAAAPFVYVNPAFHRLRRNGGNRRSAPRCRAVTSTVVISPDNHLLLPCYHFLLERVPLYPPEPDGRSPLIAVRKAALKRRFDRRQGRFPFCQGCHINCYADPSFLYVVDEYFWASLVAKLRYAFDKEIRRRFHRRRRPTKPAIEIAREIMGRP